MLSEDMYQDNILEHYKEPHNYGELPGHSVSFREVNPLCGDIIEMQVLVNGTTIRDIRFIGKGCAISQASASMLTDEVKGKTVEEVSKMEKDDVRGLLGIELSPVREKCAFLPLKALKMCLLSAEKG